MIMLLCNIRHMLHDSVKLCVHSHFDIQSKSPLCLYSVHAASFHPISIKKSYLFLSFYLANKNEK